MLTLSVMLSLAVDTSARAWLDRAADAIGIPVAHGAALRLVESSARFLADESDRAYEPYIMQPTTDTVWLDPATGVERVVTGSGVFIRSTRATFRITDSGAVAAGRAHSGAWTERAFDPWVVLAEWRQGDAAGVRFAGRRQFRDYPRIALTRPGRYGVDTLLLDARTGTPVALARTEAQYFLGPVRVRYEYGTWQDIGRGALYPYTTARTVDGRLDESRTVDLYSGGGSLVPTDRAPALVIPDSTVVLPVDPQHRFVAGPLDTVGVGSDTYLLVGGAFTSVVTRQQDTVFILDAPGGEDRAKLAHEWVDRLYPQRRAIVFVALNPVWPHIAGMRYWVAHGATVVASRPIVGYLRSVLERRWTALPDEYERSRSPAHIRGIDSASFAGGRVRLYPMEGINGETVLLAYIAPARFVWASDHIQIVSSANILLTDVRRTVAKHALSPLSTSGPHFRVVPWAAVDSLDYHAEPRTAAPAEDPAATVDAFLAAISGPAGQIRDRARIHGLLHPDARYWFVYNDSTGHSVATTVNPHEALDAAITGWEARGFFERCALHETATWGHWAQVLCTYEIRRDPAGPVAVRGTDSVQLAFDGEHWHILSLYWETETKTERIPGVYR